ncbi:MAG TPA: hypothetical protein VFF48_09020 [Brevundimonas sp.]|nr:hypothetical protein [Brevundimonas sp.]
MRIFVAALTAGLIAASGVSAGERLEDRDYLRLARCAGLTAGAGGDASAIDAVLRTANRGRAMGTRDRANVRRSAALHEMRGARGEERARLEGELSARCALPAA